MRSISDGCSDRPPKHLYLISTSVIVLALAVSLVLTTPAVLPVCACTPPPGGLPDYTVADRTNAAEVVLEGTIIALTGEYINVATVHVHRYFKGIGPAVTTISGFGSTRLCLSPVSVGQRWVFYATGDPSSGLSAHYVSQFDAVDPADPQTIAEVIAAVGHDPVLPYGFHVYLPIVLK